MAIKTLRYNQLHIIITAVLSSALLLVAIKAGLRSNSELLEAAPTRRAAILNVWGSVLDGYLLSRAQVNYTFS